MCCKILHFAWPAMTSGIPSFSHRPVIEQNLNQLGLVPYQYAAAHVRARYIKDATAVNLGGDGASDGGLEINAIHCAALFAVSFPDFISTNDKRSAPLDSSNNTIQNTQSTPMHQTLMPIYIASDSATVVQRAIAYGQKHGLTVVGRSQASEPLHFDRGREFFNNSNDWMDRSPHEFYDTFAHFYMLSLGRGSSVGVGGYGS